MDEAKLYEALGRKQLTIETQDAAYTAVLNLLASVVSGDIDASRVMVNLTERTWSVAAIGESPALPATINGLPKVVVAPVKADPIMRLREQILRGEVNGAIIG